MNDILTAIDVVTHPVRVKVIRDSGELVTIEHEPLLRQLEQAILGSGVGGGGGSRSLAAERGVLNSQALFEFEQIRRQLADWCRDLNLVPTKDACHDLRAWYAAWMATMPAAEFHLSELRRWARVIQDTLDPPKRMDHDADCPSCDAAVWFDERSKETKIHPLVITYRVDDGEDGMSANCRACGKTWNVRELAWELEMRAASP